jgi:hypothetical protein
MKKKPLCALRDTGWISSPNGPCRDQPLELDRRDTAGRDFWSVRCALMGHNWLAYPIFRETKPFEFRFLKLRYLASACFEWRTTTDEDGQYCFAVAL